MSEKWTVTFAGDARWIITNERGELVAVVLGGNRETDANNAALIANAPLMYEALQYLYSKIVVKTEGQND